MEMMKEIPAELAEFKKFFSFKGCFSRFKFLYGFAVAGFACSILNFAGFICFELMSLPSDSFRFIGWFGHFYVMLSSFEKRCRDLCMQGFGVTLIVTAFYASLIPWADKTVPNCFPVFSDIIFYVYIALFVFMVSMPGKNAKKESPVNPLLKYPNVYFALCCALYFAGKNFVIQICGADL